MANEHNEETDTDHPGPHPLSVLYSSLGTDLSIPHGQTTALSSSLLRDPSLVSSLLYPAASQALRLHVAEHTHTDYLSVTIFSNVCQMWHM